MPFPRRVATTEAAGAFGVEDLRRVPTAGSGAWAAPARASSGSLEIFKVLPSLPARGACGCSRRMRCLLRFGFVG
jgi:hypothetical protein